MPKQALTLLVLASSLALLSMAARADGGAVRVHNKSSATVTVNSESGYCCTADSGDTCSCVLTVGKYTQPWSLPLCSHWLDHVMYYTE